MTDLDKLNSNYYDNLTEDIRITLYENLINNNCYDFKDIKGFICENLYLHNLDFLYLIPNITALRLMNCKLDNLINVSLCNKLEILDCSYNNLSSLKGLENCFNLKHLDCSHNKNIESITNIKNSYNLRYLNIYSINILELVYFRNLTMLNAKVTVLSNSNKYKSNYIGFHDFLITQINPNIYICH